MADVLRLATESQGTTVDLLAGTFILEPGSWRTRTPAMNNQYSYKDPMNPVQNFKNYQIVVETMTLVAIDTPANIRSGLDAIADALEGIRKNHSEPFNESWWLEWNVDGETAKRTLLYEGSFYMPTMPGVNSMLSGGSDGNKVSKIVLSLSRHPLWEPTASPASLFTGSTSTGGGTQTYTAVGGNAPARISTTTITDLTVAGSLTEAWLGVRPIYDGHTNFEPVWDVDDGTVEDTDDTTFSGGAAEIDFANDASLIKRFYVTVDDVCAHTDFDHQTGRYLVLARSYISGGGTAGIKVYSGYNDEIPHNEVFVDNSSYKYVPVGEIQIPGWSHYSAGYTASWCRLFQLSFYAELITGSGTLYIEELVMIPSERMLYLTDAVIGSGNIANVQTLEGGTLISAGTQPSPANVYEGPSIAARNWRLPVEGGVFVFAGQGASSHVAGETVTLAATYQSRWTSYR